MLGHNRNGQVILPNLLLPNPPMTHTLQPVVRLVVSCNGEQYRVVDITGAPDGSWVRERIYAKLNIPDDSHGTFSIFPSEIGSFALGEPLDDRQLYALCRKHGDPSGGLKFFVSTSPDRPPSHYDPGYNSDLAPSFFTGNRSARY